MNRGVFEDQTSARLFPQALGLRVVPAEIDAFSPVTIGKL